MSYYMHHVPGRLRVKSPLVKRNFGAEKNIRNILSTVNGIITIYVNLKTGSILIHYNPNTLNYQCIIELLQQQGYFDVSKALMKKSSDVSTFKAGKVVGEIIIALLVDKSIGGPVLSVATVLFKAATGR